MIEGLFSFASKLVPGIILCLCAQMLVQRQTNLSFWGSFRVIAAVLHLIMSINAIPEFVDIWFMPNPIWKLSPSERLFVPVDRFSTLSYMCVLYETYLILVEILDDILEPIYVVHHTVTLTLISITATQTYGQYALPFLMGIIFGSSFFLDLRDQEIPKSPKFKEIVDILFSISFYVIRIFLWTYVITLQTLPDLAADAMTGNVFGAIATVGIFILTALNWFWAWKIFLGIRKHYLTTSKNSTKKSD